MTRHRQPSWLAVALAGAGGFFCGVVLIALLGGPKGTVRTTTEHTTRTRTHTVTHTTTVTKTVDSGPKVPDVVGERLSDAEDELQSAGYDVDTDDHTLFGIVEPDDYTVVAQDPPAGGTPPADGRITLDVRRG